MTSDPQTIISIAGALSNAEIRDSIDGLLRLLLVRDAEDEPASRLFRIASILDDLKDI